MKETAMKTKCSNLWKTFKQARSRLDFVLVKYYLNFSFEFFVWNKNCNFRHSYTLFNWRTDISTAGWFPSFRAQVTLGQKNKRMFAVTRPSLLKSTDPKLSFCENLQKIIEDIFAYRKVRNVHLLCHLMWLRWFNFLVNDWSVIKFD